MDKIELATPLRTIIVKVLSHNPKMLTVFGRTRKKTFFSKIFLQLVVIFMNFWNCSQIVKQYAKKT